MFVSTGRIGPCTRILSNDLAGVTSPVVIIVSLKWPNLTDLQIDLVPTMVVLVQYMRGSGTAVSGQCANADLPWFGQDLVPDKTAFVRVLVTQLYSVLESTAVLWPS